MSEQRPAPGYYPDPSGEAAFRRWDGLAWTTDTADEAPVAGRSDVSPAPVAHEPSTEVSAGRGPRQRRLVGAVAVVAIGVGVWLFTSGDGARGGTHPWAVVDRCAPDDEGDLTGVACRFDTGLTSGGQVVSDDGVAARFIGSDVELVVVGDSYGAYVSVEVEITNETDEPLDAYRTTRRVIDVANSFDLGGDLNEWTSAGFPEQDVIEPGATVRTISQFRFTDRADRFERSVARNGEDVVLFGQLWWSSDEIATIDLPVVDFPGLEAIRDAEPQPELTERFNEQRDLERAREAGGAPDADDGAGLTGQRLFP
ncbi:MAG: DUF2510 domain-containing protein [Actinomycetota bacterium]